MPLAFPLFVYGTLKQGFSNHERHCKTATKIQKAYTWGRVYELDAGYPALEIPESSIQARGTRDYKLDAVNRGKHLHFEQPSGDWDLVEGELMYFSQPDIEIPPMDYLEHFNPDGDCNMYDRIMLTFKTEDGFVNAWTYVINDGKYTGKRLSLNEDGLVKWTKTQSGYIEPKAHAEPSENLTGLGTKRQREENTIHASLRNCGDKPSSSCPAY